MLVSLLSLFFIPFDRSIVYAQSVPTPKMLGHGDPDPPTKATQIIFRVDGIPTDTSNKYSHYKTAVVSRTGGEGSMNPSSCGNGGADPVAVTNGWRIDVGKGYCDSGAKDNNSYTYNGTVDGISFGGENFPPINADEVVVNYNVPGNTTQSYSYLFGQSTLQGFVSRLVNWIAYVVGPLIVGIMIIYAGFQYIASRGNEAQVKEAKDRIVGSIVGYILLMLIGTIMKAVF